MILSFFDSRTRGWSERKRPPQLSRRKSIFTKTAVMKTTGHAFAGPFVVPVQRHFVQNWEKSTSRPAGEGRVARVRALNVRLPTDISTSSQDISKPLLPGTWDGTAIDSSTLIAAVKFDSAGLVPAIAQQYDSGEVLMMAWMNSDSIAETLRGGRAVYYSRSRKSLWRKGDTSGQIQVLCDILLDCDGDTLLLKVDQKGVACHTGRRTCFYKAYRPPKGTPLEIQEVLMDPNELYGSTQ
jgi:phosphoribosyl-AMP cyclohydrolase